MCWVSCFVGGAVASSVREGVKGDPCIYLGTSHSLKTNFLEPRDPQFTCLHTSPRTAQASAEANTKPPGLLEGFRLASTNTALGMQVKNNHPLPVLPEPVPGAADQHVKTIPWKSRLFSGGVAQQGDKDQRGRGGQRAPAVPANACCCNRNYRP